MTTPTFEDTLLREIFLYNSHLFELRYTSAKTPLERLLSV